MAQRPTTIRYRILIWLTLAAALSYLCRNAVGVAESSIRADLGMSLTQSGWFLGAFFWTYALLQIPSGWFAQHYGTRFSLTLFASAWSLATLGLGLAPGFWMLLIAQLLMGIAQAGIFPACCNSIGHWMPISQRSFACGILTAGMQVGAVAASALTGILLVPSAWRGMFDLFSIPVSEAFLDQVSHHTWRWVFILFSIPGLVWAVLFYLRFRNRPEQVSWLNQEELNLIRCESADVSQAPMTEAARIPPKWNWVHSIDLVYLCVQQICRSGGYMFFASWFPTFLQSTRGISVENSGYLQGLVLMGYLLGSIIGGVLTDWIWRRTGDLWLSRCGVGAASLASCGLLVLGAWFVDDVRLAVGLLALCSFCAAFAGPSTFATTIEIGGDRVPEVFGLVNMSGNLATAACPVLIGALFQQTENWNLILALFSILYLFGAVFWLLVDPRRSARQIEEAELESTVQL